jgi:hypothetical protein
MRGPLSATPTSSGADMAVYKHWVEVEFGAKGLNFCIWEYRDYNGKRVDERLVAMFDLTEAEAREMASDTFKVLDDLRALGDPRFYGPDRGQE